MTKPARRRPAPNLPSRGGRRRVPTILQMEATECGAACLAMVLAYHRLWVPLEVLRVRCGVSRDGVRASNVLRVAQSLHMEGSGVRMRPERLPELHYPCIAHWEHRHFVVVEGFRPGRVYLNDPAHGPRTVTTDAFAASFSGTCLLLEPGRGFTPGGTRPGVLRAVLARAGPVAAPLVFVVLATLLLVVPGIALATLGKVFVDEVLVPGTGALVTPLLIGLGVVAVVQCALTWMQQWCLARMEAKLATVASVRFVEHLLSLPMVFFAQRWAGDLAARVAANDRVARLVCGDLATAVASLLGVVIYGAVLLAYDPFLAAVVALAVSTSLLAVRLAARPREEAAHRLQRERARVAAATVQGIAMIESAKAEGAEGRLFARWAGLHVQAVDAQQSLAVATAALNLAPPLAGALGAVAVLGVGGYRVLEGALSVGGLVAFQSLARSFAQPFDALVAVSAALQTARADVARLDDVLRYPPEPAREAGARPPPALPAVGRSLVLDRVTFGYAPRDAPLLADFSLEVAPGRRIALVGGSGSGKSTVGRLACGLLAPWTGEVRIGGVDAASLAAERLGGLVAYVNQDIVLFDGTVRDNVTLWDATVDDRTVTEALRDATLLDAVMARPGKYEAPVGENGASFSGGQRQLLDLARALAARPEILILDEASAALDPVTERIVDRNLRRRGLACLIIAHRLSTIRDADEIVVLEAGRIVERGTHETLLARGGVYAGLVAHG